MPADYVVSGNAPTEFVDMMQSQSQRNGAVNGENQRGAVLRYVPPSSQ
jgi:hypothetical protein